MDIVGPPAGHSGNLDLIHGEAPIGNCEGTTPQTSYDHCSPRGPCRSDDQISGLCIPNGLKRLINPSIGNGLSSLDRIILIGIDCMCSSKLSCSFQFFIYNIHSNDRVSTKAAQKLDGIEPDPAATHNQC